MDRWNECSFINPWKIVDNRPKKARSTSENGVFFETFFPENVPMDRGNESTLATPFENFQQKAEKFRLTVRKRKGNKNMIRRFFLQKFFNGHVKRSFASPVRTSLLEGRNFYGRCPTMTERSFFF